MSTNTIEVTEGVVVLTRKDQPLIVFAVIPDEDTDGVEDVVAGRFAGVEFGPWGEWDEDLEDLRAPAMLRGKGPIHFAEILRGGGVMARPIIALKDDAGEPWYMEWSTVVDAPVTHGMTREEFTHYYREEYGNQGMEELDSRMSRVDLYGTSLRGNYSSIECVIGGNRAGDDETELSMRDILKLYCPRASLKGVP